MAMRVLLVDDVEDNLRRLIEEQPHGMQFIVVKDIFTALYLLYEFDLERGIEAVICNLELPGGGAYHMLSQLKTDRNRTCMPFVFFTCRDRESETSANRSSPNAIALRADKCVAMKSFDPGLLCSEVRSILGS